jgi:DNA-binding NarL/FixJ family response regulator
MRAAERPNLTPTQWLVLERLAQGEDNAAIGQALGIKLATVTEHISAIYQRLPPVSGRRSKRAAAIAWYLTVGRALREEEAQSDE